MDPENPNAALDATSDALKSNTEATLGNAAAQDTAANSSNNFLNVVSTAPAKLNNMATSLGLSGKAMLEFAESFKPSQAMFDSFAKSSTASFGTVKDSMDALQTDAKNMGVLFGKLGLSSPMLKGLGLAWLENASNGQKAEDAYLKTLSASGKLNTAFLGGTSILRDLSAVTLEYNKNLINIADSTGFTGKQVIDFAQQLNAIPGMMNSVITSSRAGGGSFDTITSALKLATGAGRDQSDVIKAMQTAYENLGNAQGKVTDGAQKGAELFATMATMSEALGISFGDSQKALTDIAALFKYTGDNTAAAAKTFGTYSKALQNTGYNAKTSTDLTSKMIEQTKDMTLAQKAFISASSGGPGGLAGIQKVELLQRAGKNDEVMAMIERAIKSKTGGKIGDQNDQSPGGFAHFVMQRQMVQGGAFGVGKGMTDDQSTHLLEALKHHDVGAFKDIMKTNEAAVKEVSEKGTAIQERNANLLTQVANESQRIAVATEMTAALELRRLVGSGGINEADLKSYMKKASDMVTNEVVQRNKEAPKGTEAEGKVMHPYDETHKKMYSDALGNILGTAPKVVTGIKDMLSTHAQKASTTEEIGPEPPVLPPPARTATATRAAQLSIEHATTANQRQPITSSLATQKTEKLPSQDITLHINVTAPKGYGATANVDQAHITNTVVKAVINILAGNTSGGG